MTMIPSVGRIVLYTLTSTDAEQINKRRDDVQREGAGQTGKVVHVGNAAKAGDACAAIVVRTFGGQAANLQVHLDGNDTLWRTSVMPQEDYTPAVERIPGRWVWPPRV